MGLPLKGDFYRIVRRRIPPPGNTLEKLSNGEIKKRSRIREIMTDLTTILRKRVPPIKRKSQAALGPRDQKRIRRGFSKNCTRMKVDKSFRKEEEVIAQRQR